MNRALAERRREKEAAVAGGKTSAPANWAGWEHRVLQALAANPDELARVLARVRTREEAARAAPEAERAKAEAKRLNDEQHERIVERGRAELREWKAALEAKREAARKTATDAPIVPMFADELAACRPGRAVEACGA